MVRSQGGEPCIVDDDVVAGAAITGSHRQRHAKMRVAMRHQGRHVIGLIQVAEDVVHYVVALVLVGVAVVVLARSVVDSFDGHGESFRSE